jgi:starch synthase
MRILFVSSEVVPFAKTGGLADVAGALPKAARKLGHDIRVFMPRYKKIDPQKWNLRLAVSNIEVELGNQKEKVDIYETRMPGSDLIVYFVENERFASRDELYMSEGKDYPDNAEAFLTFCRAAVPFLKKIDWRPDIVHCNDWQSASIVLFINEQRRSDPFFQRTATVYSIHNMAYQGAFTKDKLSLLRMPESNDLVVWDKIILTKAGFVYADVINTVSEKYSKEIQTKEFGCGLEDLLQKRSKDIYGIVNGVDYELWDPATDKKIVKRYSRMTLSLKVQNKTALQKEMGLPPKDVPLIGMISRLDVQKGFDILADGIEDLIQLDCQVIILGTGDPKYHEMLQRIKQKYPERIGIKLGFDAVLAQKIYAASDMFLMPSKYEPCGLGQLISFKYGTIPVARKTGGLADTVREFDLESGEGNGFIFEEYNSNALLSAVKKAIEIFKEKSVWKKLQEKVMDYDYSWDASAKKYISLYMKALDKVIK